MCNIRWMRCAWVILFHHSLFAQEATLVLPVGHTSSVITATYSNDGNYIVTASWDNTAKIWDGHEGKLLGELKGHTASLTSATVSPDGKYIITTSKDSTARLWQAFPGHFLFKLKGHTDWLSTACFSPNGKFVVTGSWDNTARIWNTATGKLLFILRGHKGPVNTVTVSHDGRYVLTASKDSTAKLWRVTDGSLVRTLKGHKGWVNTAAFTNNDKFILTASEDSTCALWELQSGRLLNRLLEHSAGVTMAAFSSSGKYVVTASRDNTAAIWQASDGHLLYRLRGHEAPVTMAVFSNDEKYVVTASKDSNAITWQCSDGAIVKKLHGHTGPVNSSAFSPDGKYVVTGSDDNTAKIWQSLEGNLVADLKGHTSVLTSASVSPDGKYFVTASWDNTAKIWNTGDVKLRGNLTGHTDWLNAAIFSPDGKHVATASSDNTARIWEVPNGKLAFELKGHSDWVNSVTYSPDGNLIATTSWDNTARVWNGETGKQVSIIEGHAGVICYSGFSPDSKYLVTASWDNTAKVWNVSDGRLIHDLKGHSDEVRTAMFSRDGKYIVTASWDKTARIWNANDGSLVTVLKGHRSSLNSAIFSPDGKHVLTTSMDNTARIWSVANGSIDHVLAGHYSAVITAAYSPDGLRIVTASWDHTAGIWDAVTGKLLKKLTGHASVLKSAAWSPDGKYIITTSEDNTLKRWDAFTGEFLYTFFTVDSTDYLAIDRDGHYDGTAAARKMLYYVCNNEIIDLEQFKELSWEPGLVSKLTGVNKEPITAKKLSEVNLCNFTPEVEEKGFADGEYHYNITPKRGGIGEVQLYINNKLVQTFDPALLKKNGSIYLLSVRQETVADYFVPGQYNRMLVKATTVGGTMMSRGAGFTINSDKKSAGDPDMYILAIGVSQYKGETLRLHYASKDAVDFANAISFSAQKLLNADGGKHVHTYVFNTEPGSHRWPVKAALQKLIDSIALRARSQDILVIFFAGHGVLINGQKNFFLLTADASALELNGVESDVSVSTDELKDWFRKIKANKQVLILDACNSGQVVQQLNELVIKRDMPSDQQRALESLKDKTGTFILSASASGQAAYESVLYGQGLLTYSLLSGIKLGGGLKDNRYVDIIQWFNFAADYVKLLAKDMGGRQDPQIMGNASFVIGMVDQQVLDTIRLSLQKKIFSRSKFIEDEDLLNDDLNLSSLVDKELSNASARGKESPLVFAGDNSLPDAYSVRGKYSVITNTITARVSVFKGQKERVGQFEISGTVDKKELMARQIEQKVEDYLHD